MKNKIIISIIFVLVFATSTYAQIKVLNNGNVGIGNSNPAYKLEIDGTVHFSPNWMGLVLDHTSGYGATLYPDLNNYGFIGRSDRWFNHAWITSLDIYAGTYASTWYKSDKSLKKDINEYTNVLDNLRKIKTYSYYFTDQVTEKLPENQKGLLNRKRYGFIAQEFKDIYPELVSETDSGILAIDYISMIPILSQAIKEQQTTIEDLQSEIDKLSSDKKNLKSGAVSVNENSTTAMLDQNSPNPFSQTTQIGYNIPETSSNSMLCIYDLSGSQIKSYSIQTKGKGEITINGFELHPGIYLYTLIVDAKEIDTKRMILTE